MTQAEIITNEQLINTYAQKLMEEPEVDITTQAPPESTVEILAPITIGEELIKYAEVRELTGADEEAISKTGSIGRALEEILRRGVERLGSKVPSSVDLDQLISGDRDNLLLSIRKMTFGSSVDVRVMCPSCGEVSESTVDLDTDVPVHTLDGPIIWDIETKHGIITVSMPTGSTQKKVVDAGDKTAAEIKTIFLGGCILAVDREPVIGARVALTLGAGDRDLVLKEILSAIPGPRLMEVKTSCKACGASVPAPLSLQDLFRL